MQMDAMQMRTIAAAMERILPSDERPGATTANAVAFVARLAHLDRLRERRRLLELGIHWLDSLADAMWGKSFVECEGTQQDAVLTRIQHTPHAGCHKFFAMLVRMTLNGFLCPPEYGGNDAAAGWRYIGYVPRMPDRRG